MFKEQDLTRLPSLRKYWPAIFSLFSDHFIIVDNMYAPTKPKFNLVSYNWRGLSKDKNKLDLQPDVQHNILFKDNDILCLQETWFAKQDLNIYKYNLLNKPFQGVGEGYQQLTDYSDGIVHGHPPGGVYNNVGCQLWKFR